MVAFAVAFARIAFDLVESAELAKQFVIADYIETCNICKDYREERNESSCN